MARCQTFFDYKHVCGLKKRVLGWDAIIGHASVASRWKDEIIACLYCSQDKTQLFNMFVLLSKWKDAIIRHDSVALKIRRNYWTCVCCSQDEKTQLLNMRLTQLLDMSLLLSTWKDAIIRHACVALKMKRRNYWTWFCCAPMGGATSFFFFEKRKGRGN